MVYNGNSTDTIHPLPATKDSKRRPATLQGVQIYTHIPYHLYNVFIDTLSNMERKYRTQRNQKSAPNSYYISDDIYVIAVFLIIILLNVFLIMK